VETTQTIPQLALTYFLMINPIGNYPAILALIKESSFQRQKQIMLREGIFVFILALVFQFFGDYFLKLMQIQAPALSLCGGILVFLVAIKMIFPTPQLAGVTQHKQEPFIVPIATPLLVGPGTLTIIMLTAANEPNPLKVSAAISIACTGVLAVLMAGPYLQKVLGKRGLQALEQVMGMLLVLMAVEMILGGLGNYVKSF
jgi:multiple antibiotic resistance protein